MIIVGTRLVPNIGTTSDVANIVFGAREKDSERVRNHSKKGLVRSGLTSSSKTPFNMG